ncbi:acyl-CoA dehydrogenase family protein [Millisia brevis]|uniref:acyl-CoA dehydrogenase family protein n=1 Tax=Millisia brevis TaxID=264148 RepID=UPI000836F550|nr:acyl-CoA dehydrogenase family protein [Millisia brevis]
MAAPTADDRSTELADLAAMLADLFTVGPEPATDEDGTVPLDAALWATLDELGLQRLTASESVGGSGAGWREADVLLTAAGRSAAAVPIAEHDLLATWLLEQAGLPVDGRLRTAAVLRDGRARWVPWARAAEAITVLIPTDDGGWGVADLDIAAVEVTPATNLAGEPRDHIEIIGQASGTPVPAHVADDYRYRGALARALAISGAAERIVALVVEHATGRVQFGRPIARFQAVQRMVSDLACEAELARAAAEGAVEAAALSAEVGSGSDAAPTGSTPAGSPPLDPMARQAVAVAASVTGHAAAVIARNAHQVLGAIGTTREHELHRHTNRILSWRSEFGPVGAWDRELLESAVAADGDVWRWMTRT